MKLDHPVILRIRRKWRIYSVACFAVYLLGIFTIGDTINSIPVIGPMFTMIGAIGLIGTVIAALNRKPKKEDEQ